MGSFYLSDVQCAGCDHWWRAVVEAADDDPVQVFGLECSACGESRGRTVSRRMRFDTEAEAIAAGDALNPPPAEVLLLPVDVVVGTAVDEEA